MYWTFYSQRGRFCSSGRERFERITFFVGRETIQNQKWEVKILPICVLCVWDKSIISVCVGVYMEVQGSWWLKRLPCHTLYLDVWRWAPIGPGMCLFSLKTANTKCIGPNLAGKWDVHTKLGDFLPHCCGPFCTRVFSPTQETVP